jgi:ribosomal protein S18 acetylase RimI-like enzyme
MGNTHLNLVDSSRQLFELDPGAEIEAGANWLFGAGRSSHPAISNAAFRTGEADAEEFLARARDFFGARGRGFSVWVQGDEPGDRDLVEAASSAGLQPVYEMPEMVLRRRAEERPLPPGTELRRVGGASEAQDYWHVATAAYSSIGFPPEVFRYYENYAGLTAGNVVAFLAYLDGRPVSIAMTIVGHGVAGIYWVGSLEEARGRGLGWAVTAAATNAGFDLGAEIASLQASPMGESLYAAMGFETIFPYRLLMAAPPPADPH